MRMYVGGPALSVALVLALLLGVVPALPLDAAPNDDTEASAAPDAESAKAPAQIHATPAAAAAPPVVFDPFFCAPLERGQPSATPGPAASPVTAIDLALWDFTEGIPADEATYWLLVDAVTAFFACSNAGATEAARTMVTDAYLRTLSRPSATATPAAPSVLEVSWLTFTDVDAVRMHGTDRAVVFLLMQDPGYCARDVYLAVAFRMVDGGWLVDGLADVSAVEPVAYTPPVFRVANAPQC